MKSIRSNIFEDKNISIFILLNILLDKWKIILVMAVLSIPLSGIYYFYGNELFESNAIIIIGKRFPTDRVYFEHPLLLAQKIRVESSSNRNIESAIVKTDNNAYYDKVRRTLSIKFIGTSPEIVKKELSLMTNKILKSHYVKYVLIKQKMGAYFGVNTIVEEGPSYSSVPVKPINYFVFIKGIVLSIIFSFFYILCRYRMVTVKKNS